MSDTKGREKLWELIKELVSIGAVIEVWESDEGNLLADLQTGMKSHCYLISSGSTVMAERRYDRSDQVDTLEDVVELVKDCMHGRDYLSEAWLNILKNVGYFK